MFWKFVKKCWFFYSFDWVVIPKSQHLWPVDTWDTPSNTFCCNGCNSYLRSSPWSNFCYSNINFFQFSEKNLLKDIEPPQKLQNKWRSEQKFVETITPHALFWYIVRFSFVPVHFLDNPIECNSLLVAWKHEHWVDGAPEHDQHFLVADVLVIVSVE